MNRRFSLYIALCLILMISSFALAGCGGEKKPAAPAAPQTTAPEKDKYDTPEKVETRLEALAREYGAKP